MLVRVGMRLLTILSVHKIILAAAAEWMAERPLVWANAGTIRGHQKESFEKVGP